MFDENGFCYSVITETTDIEYIRRQLQKYQNIRLLILDLDLDESGEVEETDEEMVKQIIYASLDTFGYYFLAINSSYAEKWDEIREGMLEELRKDELKNRRKIHFLEHFCIALNKTNTEIEQALLGLLSDKFSHELITQFECHLNEARDKALSPFLDFTSSTWEQLYKILREDIDSKEHVNFTLNNFLFGLLKQQIVGSNYSVPADNNVPIDNELHQNIIRGFNYLSNTTGYLDKHPVWTGNIYYSEITDKRERYLLIITPECDIAQSKGMGYTVVTGFEADFPDGYKPEDYKDVDTIPVMVEMAGKKADGNWKSKSDIENFYGKGIGYYQLLHASTNSRHIIFDLRSVKRISDISAEKYSLLLRVNEPVITDISDKLSSIINRKGVPRLVPKNYMKL